MNTFLFAVLVDIGTVRDARNRQTDESILTRDIKICARVTEEENQCYEQEREGKIRDE
jgi:hypothetical protein